MDQVSIEVKNCDECPFMCERYEIGRCGDIEDESLCTLNEALADKLLFREELEDVDDTEILPETCPLREKAVYITSKI